MKQEEIFGFSDYKTYLREHFNRRRDQEKGLRSRLAEAVRCHAAYVSQVLNGDAHFSLEQTELVAKFLTLNKSETGYLLLLVQHARAGTVTLKAHFETLMKELAAKQLVLKDRLEFNKSLNREEQATFYSSWHYGAVHVLVSVPGCHQEKGIAKYLNIPVSKVVEVLEFLLRVRLVAKTDAGYTIGNGRIHLEHDSPMISKHHTNWRLKAVQALDTGEPADLHYSSVITCAEADAPKIKAALVRAIEEVRAIVRPSKDEAGYAYCLDFFGLKG